MKMRQPILAANWKMHKTAADAATFIEKFRPLVREEPDADVVICPPFTALEETARRIKGSWMQLGAQNCYWEDQGAFTGEVAPGMLVAAGCRFVIIGHSERRQYFGETDETVARRLQAAWRHGLVPILCVGETLPQRQANRTTEVLQTQLSGALGKQTQPDPAKLVMAYEPVWAIGTGQNATAAQAQEAHAFIRRWLAKQWNDAVAQQIRIQYGGSVKPANAESLMREADVDGALVGGASLEPESFAAIVEATVRVKVAGQRAR